MRTAYKRPVLGFRNASVNQQIATCERFANGAAKLPPSKLGTMPLDELEQVLAEARAVRQELNEVRAKARATLSKQKQIMVRLRDTTTGCAVHFWAQVKGNPAELISAGLAVEKSKHVSVGRPGAPTLLRATVEANGVKVRWRAPMRRCWFSLAYAEDKPGHGNWIHTSDFSTARSHFTFKKLKNGRTYWFRVKAHNSNGDSPWSQFVRVHVM
jgi:hypothetical protein